MSDYAKFQATKFTNGDNTELWVVEAQRKDDICWFDVFEDPSEEVCKLTAELLNAKFGSLTDNERLGRLKSLLGEAVDLIGELSSSGAATAENKRSLASAAMCLYEARSCVSSCGNFEGGDRTP